MNKKVRNRIIKKITDNLSFYQVFSDIVSPEIQYGNYRGCFCGKKGKFSIHLDTYGKCFNNECGWSGDVIQLYKDMNDIFLIDTLNELNEKYNLNISELDKVKQSDEYDIKLYLQDEKVRYDKYIFDCNFIKQFKIMMVVNDISVKDLIRELGLKREDLSRVLNENYDNKQLSFKKWCILIKHLYQYYQDNLDTFHNNLAINDINDKVIEYQKKINQYCEMVYGE